MLQENTLSFLKYETNSRALISTKITKMKQENCPHFPTMAKQANSWDMRHSDRILKGTEQNPA